ncbi:MAG: caspase family protein [Pyrinomonadaceae bacterium]
MNQRTRLSKLMMALVWALAVCVSVMAQEREPSREPILRIETGMHTAPIKRIGVDAANRYLVTASNDKTVRVWELPSGRLLRVIRVPIGEGNEGKLNAVALSPDGSTIAASGWTSTDGLHESIYLFDRESGRLIRRLGGLPNVVNHLVYSPDGRFLAATLFGKNGVRVFTTAAYAPAGEDRDYGDTSYGADFDRTGRLVTTSSDGFIRLYAIGRDGSLRLLAKQSAAGGQHPYAVKFSPDGTRLAIGFDDSTEVAVLRTDDLAPLYAPDTTGVNNGNLISVAWSADGRTLYAGGKALDANNTCFIRVWTDDGRGRYRDIAGAGADTILRILPLRDGGIVYGTGGPSFGVIDESGSRKLFTTAAIADYRDNHRGFLLAPDGMGVGFAYQQFGQSPARFSLADRKLDTAPAGSVSWRPPETEDHNIHVTDWKYTYTPKLNGTPLKLKPYEISRSLALAPDISAFLLGTEWYLRLFNRNGTERWRVAAPGSAWAVNISSDGKLAVAAYGDGTIRWYRMTDGKELLAFFPHKDRKRWVLWMPSGYYDASPGAEDLIGWHVNNGRDAAADFFPVGQFRDTYYRPDVIARVLQTGDESRALQLANDETGRRQQQTSIAQQLPPVVEIVSPADGATISSNEVTVRFNVRSPSGEPLTNVKALVDGRPAGARQLVQGEAASGGAREIKISVPERDSEVSIIAENRFAASTPATVRLKWRGAAVTTATRTESYVIRPKLYILAVGVSNYTNAKYNLQFADKDAQDFVSTMQLQKGLLYRDVIVYQDKALTNEQATKDEILDGLDWIRKETTSNDVAMIFFAGHGVNDQNNYYFFCPHNIDPDRLLRTGVAFSDIKNAVSAIAGKALFFVDTCHSGNSLGLAGRRGGLDINIVINELSSAANGIVVFSASTGSESSYERLEWNNGAFTKALVEGLNGAAAVGSTGRITYAMLNLYISERVKELTKGRQHPTMISPQTVPDFPVAVRR